MKSIGMTVNGESHSAEVEPRQLLVYFLREHACIPQLRNQHLQVELRASDQIGGPRKEPDWRPPDRQEAGYLDHVSRRLACQRGSRTSG